MEAEETVTVPAGTFKTLRIQSAPGKYNGWIITRWYAPELGLTVKRHSQRTSEHRLGSSEVFERVVTAVELPPTG